MRTTEVLILVATGLAIVVVFLYARRLLRRAVVRRAVLQTVKGGRRTLPGIWNEMRQKHGLHHVRMYQVLREIEWLETRGTVRSRASSHVDEISYVYAGGR